MNQNTPESSKPSFSTWLASMPAQPDMNNECVSVPLTITLPLHLWTDILQVGAKRGISMDEAVSHILDSGVDAVEAAQEP